MVSRPITLSVATSETTNQSGDWASSPTSLRKTVFPMSWVPVNREARHAGAGLQ